MYCWRFMMAGCRDTSTGRTSLRFADLSHRTKAISNTSPGQSIINMIVLTVVDCLSLPQRPRRLSGPLVFWLLLDVFVNLTAVTPWDQSSFGCL